MRLAVDGLVWRDWKMESAPPGFQLNWIEKLKTWIFSDIELQRPERGVIIKKRDTQWDHIELLQVHLVSFSVLSFFSLDSFGQFIIEKILLLFVKIQCSRARKESESGAAKDALWRQNWALQNIRQNLKNISLKKGKCVFPDDSLLSLMSVCTNMTLMDCRRHIWIKCDIKCDEDGLQKNQWNTGLVWIPAPKQNGAKRHKKVALITFAR